MKRLLIILTCFLIYSCHNQELEKDLAIGKYHLPEDALLLNEEIEIEPPRTAEPPPSPPSEFSLDKGSKIIKNGNMNFEVTKLEEKKIKVDSLIKSVNGYYENESYISYGNRITYSLRIRVPNTKFDSLIYLLENGIGELISKNVSVTDVTEEYVDISIRLENNLAYLKQYQSILVKANSIKEILDVQEKIRRIEEEIDSKKERLKYLDGKVKYSTLDLEISELITRELVNKPNFSRRILNAFHNGIQGFLNFIVAIVNFWPFFLLIMFLYLGRKPIINRIKKKSATANND